MVVRRLGRVHRGGGVSTGSRVVIRRESRNLSPQSPIHIRDDHRANTFGLSPSNRQVLPPAGHPVPVVVEGLLPAVPLMELVQPRPHRPWHPRHCQTGAAGAKPPERGDADEGYPQHDYQHGGPGQGVSLIVVGLTPSPTRRARDPCSNGGDLGSESWPPVPESPAVAQPAIYRCAGRGSVGARERTLAAPWAAHHEGRPLR